MEDWPSFLENGTLLPDNIFTEKHYIFSSESFKMLHLGIFKYINSFVIEILYPEDICTLISVRRKTKAI